MRKQLKMLESVPAREVNKFMLDNQIQAVSKIQAGFKGMMCRRQMKFVKEELRRTRAAKTIQRQVSCRIKDVYLLASSVVFAMAGTLQGPEKKCSFWEASGGKTRGTLSKLSKQRTGPTNDDTR